MKLHISLAVKDFETSLHFYTNLFNQQPSVQRDGYAKWDVEAPAVNFAIERSDEREGIDHLGIQADTQDELKQLAGRLRDSGRPFLDVAQVDCCHASMDKAWIKGMADEKWEVFLTHRHDLEHYGETQQKAIDTL